MLESQARVRPPCGRSDSPFPVPFFRLLRHAPHHAGLLPREVLLRGALDVRLRHREDAVEVVLEELRHVLAAGVHARAGDRVGEAVDALAGEDDRGEDLPPRAVQFLVA